MGLFSSASRLIHLPAAEVEVLLNMPPELKPAVGQAFERIVRQVFLDSPNFDLSIYLDSDIALVARRGEAIGGLVFARRVGLLGRPVLHLCGACLRPEFQSQGLVQEDLVAICLNLAAESFGGDSFHVAVRTSSPRAVGGFWHSPWFRLYPRPDEPTPPEVARLAGEFCRQIYGAHGYDPQTQVLKRAYPGAPNQGRPQWHHEEAVNEFCRCRLDINAGDAFIFLGPTTPPLPRVEIRG